MIHCGPFQPHHSVVLSLSEIKTEAEITCGHFWYTSGTRQLEKLGLHILLDN